MLYVFFQMCLDLSELYEPTLNKGSTSDNEESDNEESGNEMVSIIYRVTG